MARKPKSYRLKPYPLARLPKGFQSAINRAKNLVKRIKKVKIPDTSFEELPVSVIKKIQGLLNTLNEIIDANIDWDELGKHFKYQDAAYEILDELRSTFKRLKENSDQIYCGITGQPCEDDLWTSYEDNDISDGTAISSILSYMEHNELLDFIHLLPLVYAAYVDFSTQLKHLTDIGPFSIYLESGGFLDIEPEEIDRAINATLDAIGYVYRKLRETNIPDYSIKGPIILELGLPPLDYGGVYSIKNNEVRVTLKSISGIPLSANYEHIKDTNLEYRLFGGILASLNRRRPVIERIPIFYTIAHELAHRIYYRGLRPKAKRAWDDIYAYFGLNEEEQELLSEYHRLKTMVEEAVVRVEWCERSYPGLLALKESNKRALRSAKKALRTHKKLLSKELIELYEIHQRYDFSFPIRTFSKMKWTTEYGRSNREEAFAETFLTTIWPDANHGYKELTKEDAQNLIDTMWYFVKSISPQKPRR
jgi:hypothetical protein